MQTDQHAVHQQGGDDRLQDADDGGLLAGVLQLGETELIADREGNKAERDIAKDREALYLLHIVKPKSLHANEAEAVRTHQNTGHQIGGHRRQIQ